MTKRRRTDALVRDIARLINDYDADDWRPVLAELAQGSAMQQRIAQAITELVPGKPSTKRRGATKAATSEPDPVVKTGWLHPERADALESLRKDLKARELLPNMAAVRELFALSGGKDLPPRNRDAAIPALLALLDRLPDQRYQSMVEAIGQSRGRPPKDFDGDYGRWFALILNGSSKEADLRNLHNDILSLMDRALVRGANTFSSAERGQLAQYKRNWLASSGNPDAVSIIDEFMSAVIMARDAAAGQHDPLNLKVTELKAAWRLALPGMSDTSDRDDGAQGLSANQKAKHRNP